MAAINLIETRNLGKIFGGLQAVKEVNFTLPQGEIRAIIGANGAGKTTFVSLISGRQSPTSGTIFFKGVDITSQPAWKRVRLGIAYTFQITSIYPSLSVYENVAIAARAPSSWQRPKQSPSKHPSNTLANDRRDDQIDSRVAEVLNRVGLNIDARRQAGQIAYGHQRLLEIAMGLALHPELLILDEPTQGLSSSEINRVSCLIQDLRATTTILLIEHNIAMVTALADTITVLDQGRILAEGSPHAIQNNPAVQAAYLGRSLPAMS